MNSRQICGKQVVAYLQCFLKFKAFSGGWTNSAGLYRSGEHSRVQHGFGIVFQAYSPFSNMTVAENVGYGLRIRGETAPRIKPRVVDLLDLIQLPRLSDT